jgi:CTP synthase (UTP-ammonia lyase)
MGIEDADSAEHHVPTASHIIVPVSCAVPNRAPGAPKLSGENQVRALPGTKLAAILGTAALEERFFCNYEVNDAFRPRLEAAGMKVSAVGHQRPAPSNWRRIRFLWQRSSSRSSPRNRAASPIRSSAPSWRR